MTLQRKPRPVWRPPATVPLLRDRPWKALCRRILTRDLLCRYCGQAQAQVVDHVLPRRLCESRAQADQEDGLAGLCPACHALKTHHVEPRLYRGDVQRFEVWVRVLKRSGPVPSAEAIARAYNRLTREVRR